LAGKIVSATVRWNLSPSGVSRNTARGISDQESAFRELQSQGITFAFARVRDQVRERMRLAGVEAFVSSTNFHERVTDGVRAWQKPEGLDAVSAGARR
jgi:hypothetical protein